MNKELNDLIEKHYKENFARLSRFYRFRRGVRDGEDLIHDAYVKILEFNIIPRNFDKFFKVVVERTFIDSRRKDKTKRDFSRDNRAMFSREVLMEFGPDEISVINEIEKLIENMNGKTRDILYLAFCCQLDPRDITMLVNATTYQIADTVYRFRLKLKNSNIFSTFTDNSAPHTSLRAKETEPKAPKEVL